MKAFHILISGRVQGVGFRWFTERQAARFRIAGFARNLPDGRVEVLAQGGDEDVEGFCAALRRGPAHAEVEGWEPASVPVDDNLTEFNIRT